MSKHTILYCDCANANFVQEESKQLIRQALAVADQAEVIAVADLCGLAARQDKLLQKVANAEKLTVLACYPRTIRSLFAFAGSPLCNERTIFLNMRDTSGNEILRALGLSPAPDQELIEIDSDRNDAWRPWFPIIDPERCSNCGQCLNFCLFGVYSRNSDGQVVVKNPTGCKNNCPSCARICPCTAIIFPKIDEESPINGSLQNPAATPDKVRLKVEDLYGGNLSEKLKQRRKRRLLKREAFLRDETNDAPNFNKTDDN